MMFYLDRNPQLAKFAERAEKSPLMAKFTGAVMPLKTMGEIIPHKTVPVIVMSKDGTPEIHPMGWGFTFPAVPGKTAQAFVYEASVASVREKESTKDLFVSKRCMIPASYAIVNRMVQTDVGRMPGERLIVQPEGEEIVYMAGIFRIEEGLPMFLMLTHSIDNDYDVDRIPVFIPQANVRNWLDPNMDPMKLVKAAITKCYFENL